MSVNKNNDNIEMKKINKSEIENQLNDINEFMNEIENDPKLKKRMEENQRKYGILTEEDLKKQFTI